MEFDRVIKKRKSARSFKKKIASWKDALEAIDAALQGPYAGNFQTLKYLIIENPKTIKELASHSQQTWIAESGILIVVCSNDVNLEKLYGERGRVYSRQQAGAAINTILLKLSDLGVDSCWIGSYSDDLIKEKLRIPQHMQIEGIIPLGYESANKKTKKPKKKDLESALYWEIWDKKKRPTFFDEGDETMARYRHM